MKKFNKKTESNYDYWQNLFDGHASYMLAADYNEYAILRRLILSYIDDGERVLDVGCACGDTYGYAIELGRDIHYIGTDYVEKFIEANKQRLPEGNWQVMDARKLEFDDNTFDTVVMYDVLDGLVGWEQAIDEAYRVTEKKIIILMWCDGAMDEKKSYLENKGMHVVEMDIQGSVHYHKFLLGVKS